MPPWLETNMKAAIIDRIARVVNEGSPHIGAETEGIVIDTQTLEVVHTLNGQQSTEAVKRWIRKQCTKRENDFPEDKRDLTAAITSDIPETTIECNPKPMRSPISSAASQRLMAIIVDAGLQNFEVDAQLLNGAAWRPPNVTEVDASHHVPYWKRFYYQYQIKIHGDSIASAAGDHLNFSAPWMGNDNPQEVSRKMIEMTGRMRLIAGALSIALSAASPLYHSSNGGTQDTRHETVITRWRSARLGAVWPGRTIMDVAPLFENRIKFVTTLEKFAQRGILLTGRDLWLPARAQAGTIKGIQSFEDTCDSVSLDLAQEGDRSRAQELLSASFKYGPRDEGNRYVHDPQWQAIEKWRQNMLQRIIYAPRNRVELRTLETPPAFENQTPYEYIKAVHTFLELLFIYLSLNPDCTDLLEYDSLNLQAAKNNERSTLLRGMDADIHWIPDQFMRKTTPRELLQYLLDEIRDLCEGLEREKDLELIKQLAQGTLLPPAERIRREVGNTYNINVEQRDHTRMLPNDDYPKFLLERNRTAMTKELEQIKTDMNRIPAGDIPFIQHLLDTAKHLRAED